MTLSSTISTGEVMRLAGVSRMSVSNWGRAGYIVRVVGFRGLWVRSSVEAFLAARNKES